LAYPYSVVVAHSGCEAGNELDVRDQFVLADTDVEAARHFDRLVQLCQSHVSESARMIDESDGALTWTSPYIWFVVWIRMPILVELSDDVSGKAADLDMLFPNGLGDHIVRQAGGGDGENGPFVEDCVELDLVWETLESNM
jgi:hypothetical protein